MLWHRYHFSVEYFEDLRNVNHCEFVIMRKNLDSGKYILENNLRTWSALKLQETEQVSTGGDGDPHFPNESLVEPKIVRWGGCPDGCTHGNSQINPRGEPSVQKLDRREPTTSLSYPPSTKEDHAKPSISEQLSNCSYWSSGSHGSHHPDSSRQGSTSSRARPTSKSLATPHRKVQPAKAVTSLHSGRDFGGSESGLDSRSGSFEDTSGEEQTTPENSRARRKPKRPSSIQSEVLKSHHAVDALGDHDAGSGDQQSARRPEGPDPRPGDDMRDDVY